jgi:membrane protease YdiL (CAAX protease family)
MSVSEIVQILVALLGIAIVAHAFFSFMRKAPPVEPDTPFAVTWLPLEAVTITIATYLISTFLAALALAGYYALWGGGVSNIDQSSTLSNFVFILIFEGLTLALLAVFLRRRKADIRSLGIKKLRLVDIGYALIGFAAYFLLYYAVYIIGKTYLPWIDFEQEQELGFSTAVNEIGLLIIFFSLVILAPIVEEVVTRGFLYSGLRSKLPIIPAAVITSMLFAIAHLQAGNDKPLLWVAAIDTFILSLVLVALRERTHSLSAPIMLHMLKNSIAFCFLFVIPRLT